MLGSLRITFNNNYDEWSRAIQTSLMAKKKYGFVEGKIPKPTEAGKLEDWCAVQSMLVAWLLNTIEPKISSTLSYYDEVLVLWKHLKNRFCVVNGTKICQLKSSLGDCKQRKNEDVATYFGRFSKIWDDLVTYVKVPMCKCGGCTCEMGSQIAALREEDMQHHFLISLDSSMYGTVRSTLLSQEPLLGIDKAYARVIQEERLVKGEFFMVKDDCDNVMAFKVQSDARGKSKNYDSEYKFCNHCNREGHDESGCFQLHGFPEWWGDSPRGGRGPGRGGGVVERGSGRGRGYTNRNKGSARANKTIVTATGSSQQQQSAQLGDGPLAAGLAGMTTTQWQQLLDLLNQSKSLDYLNGKNDDLAWIIDTGATHHVTGNFGELTNVRNIAECPIGLPYKL
ncbi:hypothetical protein ACHQM5_028155 [Ranunculus cassubicifolius]